MIQAGSAAAVRSESASPIRTSGSVCQSDGDDGGTPASVHGSASESCSDSRWKAAASSARRLAMSPSAASPGASSDPTAMRERIHPMPSTAQPASRRKLSLAAAVRSAQSSDTTATMRAVPASAGDVSVASWNCRVPTSPMAPLTSW